MVETTHERKGRFITDLTSPEGQKKDWGSCNKAKAESRRIQLADGGLGMGAVRVVK